MTTKPKPEDNPTDDEDPVDPPAEDEDDDESGDSPEGFDPKAIAAQISESLKADMESIVDSRVGKLMRTLQKDYGLKKGGQTDDDDSKRKPQGQGLIRVLRSAVRDEITSRFDDKVERKNALSLAKSLADARGLGDDEDEDEVAAEIADAVENSLGGLQEHYEAALRSDLERRGLLKPDPDGQPGKTTSKKKVGPTAMQAFNAGKELAEKRFGSSQQ